ncbi:MAG TPA: DUF2795 domain-containing protein [Negativicutes bacterium]|jgi:hypothetical protein
MPGRNVGRGGGESPANVTKNLKGIDFPAKKQDLIKHAQHEHADKDVLSQLQNIEDREYQNMADVMKDYGKERQGSKQQQEPQKQQQKSRK